MVTTKLVGGLANNLFQIAAAYTIALDMGTKAIFNNSVGGMVHRPISAYKNNILSRVEFTDKELNMNVFEIYNERGFHYHELPRKNNLLLKGYFQSWKYLDKHKEEIYKLFKPTKEVEQYMIDNCPLNKFTNLDVHKDNYLYQNCSIHVRRGDYVRLKEHHPPCTMEYYNEAMSHMPDDTIYYIFSDDMEWCKKNFIGEQFIFVEGEEDYIDLYMMAHCHHNIIANSSFSWWGAWMNRYTDKIVVAPKRWFGEAKKGLRTNDILPEEWIKI